jgi:phosphoribosylanthranilate isomerase
MPFENLCDYSFDTKGKVPGGNGTIDWNVLQHYPSSKPFFLWYWT